MDPIAIYEDLKSRIVWLDIKPGSTLNMSELAEEYKVSRNPITVALTRLDAEELVVKHGAHYVVSSLTVDRMREITEIRALLEFEAAMWAMTRITGEGLDDLAALREEILHLEEGTPTRKLVEMDERFHKIIYRETHNQCLVTILQKMLNHYLRFWLTTRDPVNPEVFFKETLEIIGALENKDEAALKKACAGHVRASFEGAMGISRP